MRFAFVICVLGLTCFVAAQQQEQPYEESIEVRLNNLDAVVTDREGKPVAGLTKADFVLLENGVAQEITNFSAYDERNARVSLASGVKEQPAAAAATSTSTEAPPPRRIVFFIDEMSIQSSARKKLKMHALEMVKAMRPGDVAAIVRPTGTTRMEQDYTGDVETVERSLGKAIDSCRISLTAPAFLELQALRRALQNADTPNEINSAKREYVDRATDRVEQRLGQLRALVASMSGTPGRKILVIITSGLSMRPGEEVFGLNEQLGIFEAKKDTPSRDMLDADGWQFEDQPTGLAALKDDAAKWDRGHAWEGMERAEGTNFGTMIDNLARTAAAEGVTIYALEPEVPLFLDMTRGADSRTDGTFLTGDATLRNVIPPEMISQLLHSEAQTLTSMADKTGGRWFRGVGEIDETFEQMQNDFSVYYSLAYRMHGSDAKPRTLKLAVKNRPDLKVRTRSETIDHTKARGMADRVVAELLYPGSMDDLQMTVTTNEPKRDGKMFVVPVEVVIPAEKMTFVRSPHGYYVARVSLHYATAIDKKEFVSYGRQEQVVELDPQQYARYKSLKYRYTSSITVPKGDVRIALGVTDTTSSLSSLKTVAVKTH